MKEVELTLSGMNTSNDMKDMSHFPLCVFILFGFLELETDMNTRPQV